MGTVRDVCEKGLTLFNKGMGALGDLAFTDSLESIAYIIEAAFDNHHLKLYATSFTKVTNFMYMGRLGYMWLRPVSRETIKHERELVRQLALIVHSSIGHLDGMQNLSEVIAQKALRMTFSNGVCYRDVAASRSALDNKVREIVRREIIRLQIDPSAAINVPKLTEANCPIQFQDVSILEKGSWFFYTVGTITGALVLGRSWGLFELSFLTKYADRLGFTRVFGSHISLKSITIFSFLMANVFKYLESDRRIHSERGYRMERAYWEKINAVANGVLYGLILISSVVGINRRVIAVLVIGIKSFSLVEKACKPSSPNF